MGIITIECLLTLGVPIDLNSAPRRIGTHSMVTDTGLTDSIVLVNCSQPR